MEQKQPTSRGCGWILVDSRTTRLGSTRWRWGRRRWTPRGCQPSVSAALRSVTSFRLSSLTPTLGPVTSFGCPAAVGSSAIRTVSAFRFDTATCATTSGCPITAVTGTTTPSGSATAEFASVCYSATKCAFSTDSATSAESAANSAAEQSQPGSSITRRQSASGTSATSGSATGTGSNRTAHAVSAKPVCPSELAKPKSRNAPHDESSAGPHTRTESGTKS